MTSKLNYFEQKDIAKSIHEYLTKLPNVEFDDSAKGPTLGYKVNNQRFKFATLNGRSNYQSLVLHVKPGGRNTGIEKELQKEIQKELEFDISKDRSYVLKPNEVFIPLERLNKQNPVNRIMYLIFYFYYRQVK